MHKGGGWVVQAPFVLLSLGTGNHFVTILSNFWVTSGGGGWVVQAWVPQVTFLDVKQSPIILAHYATVKCRKGKDCKHYIDGVCMYNHDGA